MSMESKTDGLMDLGALSSALFRLGEELVISKTEPRPESGGTRVVPDAPRPRVGVDVGGGGPSWYDPIAPYHPVAPMPKLDRQESPEVQIYARNGDFIRPLVQMTSKDRVFVREEAMRIPGETRSKREADAEDLLALYRAMGPLIDLAQQIEPLVQNPRILASLRGAATSSQQKQLAQLIHWFVVNLGISPEGA